MRSDSVDSVTVQCVIDVFDSSDGWRDEPAAARWFCLSVKRQFLGQRKRCLLAVSWVARERKKNSVPPLVGWLVGRESSTPPPASSVARWWSSRSRRAASLSGTTFFLWEYQ